MKFLVMISMLLFSASSFAKVEYNCAVEKLEDDNFFDTALEQVDNGDEDYAYVSLDKKGSKYSLKVGGFRFPRPNTADKIQVTKTSARVLVKVESDSFGNFSWSHDATNNCSYLTSGNGKTIAKTNCLYGVLDKNPCQSPNIHW